MKSLMLLWKTLADELASGCRTSTTRDWKTVTCRVKHEGQSFLTITLPQFGKDFEKSLDTGVVDRQDFQGFAWRSGLPVFLQGFLDLVFDRRSGRLLDDPNIEAIKAIRQLTLLFGKMHELPTEERVRAAMKGFIECEQEVKGYIETFDETRRKRFRRVSNILFGRTFLSLERKLQQGDFLLPDHGPGATADGLKGNRKWRQQTWPVRLEKVFPSVDYLLPNYSFYEELEDVHFLEPEDEIPVKVISVPKTQKTPRIIAMEPTAMQYAQQALRRLFYDSVERDNLLNTLIGFTDQTPNQRLAMKGSLDGSLATLDLSEASDRVSFEHVRELFYGFPLLFEAVDACRSRKAQVPGYAEAIPLTKFASMGSALSFPMEAMVFITLIFIGIEERLNRPLTRKDVEFFSSSVRVFGDDIIIPVDYVDSVVLTLESYGSKVNKTKSFWTGRFRESCGKEYYAGEDVSIVRVRRRPPTERKDAQEVISWVSLANQCYKHGYWRSVKLLDSLISGILKDYPVVSETSPVLGRVSFMGYETQKMHATLHSPLVKGWVEHTVIPRNSLDDHYALLKCFLQQGDLPIVNEDHLERSGRPFVVDIKRRWTSPF